MHEDYTSIPFNYQEFQRMFSSQLRLKAPLPTPQTLDHPARYTYD